MAENANWKERAAAAYTQQKSERERKEAQEEARRQQEARGRAARDAVIFAPLLAELLGIEAQAVQSPAAFGFTGNLPVSSGQVEIDGVQFVLLPEIFFPRQEAPAPVSSKPLKPDLPPGVGLVVDCPFCVQPVALRVETLAQLGQYLARDLPNPLPGHTCDVSSFVAALHT